MRYEFRSDDGRVIVLDYPMSEAPDEGFQVEVDGVVYKRIISFDALRSRPLIKADRHFRALNLPLNYKYHTGEFDTDGTPLVDSWRTVRETVAKANHHGENLTYDG